VRFHHVPPALPLAPRPRPGELRSGWLRRVAAANGVAFPELLHALTTTLPDGLVDTLNLDYGVPQACCDAIARWCRLHPSSVERLDLAHLFPATPAGWFVHDLDACSRTGLTHFDPIPCVRFCVACVREQQERSDVVHLRATWSLAWLTHRPDHHCWFMETCVSCHRPDVLDFVQTVHGVLSCHYCGTSLNLFMRSARWQSSVLSLQQTLLACSLMQRPGPSWVGRCGPRAFLRLAHDLLHLVMQRDEHDCSVLADYLPERDWDFPRLRLRAHHRFPTLSACERFALLSAVTAVLLGPSAASPRTIDPVHRLWQVLTPPRRRALVTAARRWPQRIRERVFAAQAGRHSTISIHRSTI
jgi:TniQ protein